MSVSRVPGCMVADLCIMRLRGQATKLSSLGVRVGQFGSSFWSGRERGYVFFVPLVWVGKKGPVGLDRRSRSMVRSTVQGTITGFAYNYRRAVIASVRVRPGRGSNRLFVFSSRSSRLIGIAVSR